ncbi:MAG: chromate resistance protein [Anaerolineae bacterium]|nr:chromate resistance protein [Anaerolineae bacterium]
MKWVTRENVKVDRVACPWLIERFIDHEAELLFVPAEEVLEVAEREGAISYDAQGAGQYDHREGKCTFEVLVEEYNLDEDDLALWLLADIVHGADTADRDRTPQSAGLRAIAEGFHYLDVPDEERLFHGFAIYDALYAWCQHQLKMEVQ